MHQNFVSETSSTQGIPLKVPRTLIGLKLPNSWWQNSPILATGLGFPPSGPHILQSPSHYIAAEVVETCCHPKPCSVYCKGTQQKKKGLFTPKFGRKLEILWVGVHLPLCLSERPMKAFSPAFTAKCVAKIRVDCVPSTRPRISW